MKGFVTYYVHDSSVFLAPHYALPKELPGIINGFREAVVEAVNLGGDADTNGAITGGLAGAWYGYDAIPEDWIAALDPDVRDTLNRLADAAVSAREG